MAQLTPLPRTPARLLIAIAVVGLAAALLAVERWSPDAALEVPDLDRVLARAESDAGYLGYQLEGEPTLGIVAGSLGVSTESDLAALVDAVEDPAQRRLLLAEAPPVRLGLRYARATDARGTAGGLLLEYDGDGSLTGAVFGFDRTPAAGAGAPVTVFQALAGRLVRSLLGPMERVPEPEFNRLDGRLELVFPQGEGEPGAYLFFAGPEFWYASRQPVAHAATSRQAGQFWSFGGQALYYCLILIAVLVIGILFRRLALGRAGFGQVPLVATLLVLGLAPALPVLLSGSARLLFFLSYFVLAHLIVLLFWVAGEAELREANAAAVEQMDRLVCRKPLASTGTALLEGVALGAGLAGFLAIAGEAVAPLGGGYGRTLLILPPYWLLPTALSQALGLTAVTAVMVGFGSRIGGRPGAIVGIAATAPVWALASAVTPFAQAALVGLVAALFAGWVAHRRGLLILAVTLITGLSIPSLWVSAQHWSLLTGSALTSALPLGIAALGFALWRRAPRHSDGEPVVPAYVSKLRRQARLEAEVDLLRDFQLALLPPEELREQPGLQAAWRMAPADVVGGDYFDLLEDDSGRLWMAVADVAGHGIACSVLTAFTKAAVAQNAVPGIGPAEAVTRIRPLFRHLRLRRPMVTLLLAVWDPTARSLRVATAGHPPLLLWNGSEVLEIGCPSWPLGVGGRSVPADCEQVIENLDDALMVAFTDGVPEALSPRGELFTYDVWPQRLPGLAGFSAEAALTALLDEVDRHRGEAPADDDLTAVVVKLKG